MVSDYTDANPTYATVCRNFTMNTDSPFTPNQPVNPDFFTGREDQINELLLSVRKAAKGNLQVGWISGERGIGKSSLASFVGFLAERDQHALSAHVHLGGVHELKDMVRETHLSLLKDNQRKSWGKNLWDLFEKKIDKIGLFGVDIQLKMSENELDATANNFAESIGQIIKQAGNDRNVLFLILDDIDDLADTPRFAHWLKSMVDGAATSKTETPVCLIFVGLEERLDTMIKNNPSVGRVFRPMLKIEPWTQSEGEDFFRNAFDKHNVCIAKEDVEILARFSGGLPTVAHEIGDAVWQIAEDNTITKLNCFIGVIDAADSIGKRFIEKDVIQALQSEKYRSILWKIADKIGDKLVGDIVFSKKELRSLKTLTPEEKKALDNFLTRMRNIGGIVPVKNGERGIYRFPTHMHAIYFLLRSVQLKKTQLASP